MSQKCSVRRSKNKNTRKTKPAKKRRPATELVPSLPPIPPPRWVPPGVQFDMLERSMQLALVEVVEPLYEELVLQVSDPLERSTGLTIVHIVWLEIVDQHEMGRDYSQISAVLGIASPERSDMIAQHLRIVDSKVRTGQFLMQIRQFQARHFNPPAMPLRMAEPRPLLLGPTGGGELEKSSFVDQKIGSAVEVVT